MTSCESSLNISPDTFGLPEPEKHIDSEPLCNTLENPKYCSEDPIEIHSLLVRQTEGWFQI